MQDLHFQVVGKFTKHLLVIVLGLVWNTHALAVTLTFDEVIVGETSYSFDGDGDTLPDAIFTTTDPSGFNTTGPGPNMSYIEEPGLEGTNELSPDLQVDFPNGAVGSLGFGFAVSATANSPDLTVSFNIYDDADALLASSTVLAAYTEPSPPTPSSFPEALVSLSFSGTASYATFDFDNSSASRYIIDNFTGTFGSTEDVTPPSATPVQYVPVPALGPAGTALLALLLGLFGFAVLRRA